MSLYIASLNSGSNGNCYYIGNKEDGVLVDAGISCKEVEKRMDRLGLSVSKVRAVFITHEHTDHIFGLPVLAKKYQLPVYITDRTLQQCATPPDKKLAVNFKPYVSVQVGGLSVTGFPKNHDACDPHSFIVKYSSVCVGVFTDIGRTCENVASHFSECNAAFLESNYDEAMLMGGKYPYFLKNRIKGGLGHLSNAQAYRLYTENRSPGLTHLILSHLSKENNTPEIVADLFRDPNPGPNIIVASRYQETPVFEVKPFAGPIQTVRRKPIRQKDIQLSLF